MIVIIKKKLITMRAGSLKYTIKLLVSKLTSDSFGAKTEEWIVYADVRAGIIYKGGNKNISDYEMFNSSNIDFTMRYDKLINEQMRINFNNKIYKIASLNKNPFDNSLIVSAELIVGATSANEISLTGTTWVMGGTSGSSGSSGINGSSGSSGINGSSGSSGIN